MTGLDKMREALLLLLDCGNAVIGADPYDEGAQEAFTMYDNARIAARQALLVRLNPDERETLTTMSEAQIKYLVDRFLGWQLPENFNPDAGIKYTRPTYPSSWPGPSGTNLLDVTQADEMVRYMIDGMPNT